MNDDTPTIENPEPPDREEPTAPTEVQQPEAGPQRLRRSTSDRVIAGVAGGLGRYFGVDPVMFRIGFVISVFFGGLGAIAYGLLWLFVPTDGEPDRGERARRAPAARRILARRWTRLPGVARPRRAALAGGHRRLRRRGRLGDPGCDGDRRAGDRARGDVVPWRRPLADPAGRGARGRRGRRGGHRPGFPGRDRRPRVPPAVGHGDPGRWLRARHRAAGGRPARPELEEGQGGPSGHSARRRGGDRVRTGKGLRRRLDPRRRRRERGGRTAQPGVQHRPLAGLGRDDAAPRLVLDADVAGRAAPGDQQQHRERRPPGYGPGPFHEDTAPLRAAEARACATG